MSLTPEQRKAFLDAISVVNREDILRMDDASFTAREMLRLELAEIILRLPPFDSNPREDDKKRNELLGKLNGPNFHKVVADVRMAIHTHPAINRDVELRRAYGKVVEGKVSGVKNIFDTLKKTAVDELKKIRRTVAARSMQVLSLIGNKSQTQPKSTQTDFEKLADARLSRVIVKSPSLEAEQIIKVADQSAPPRPPSSTLASHRASMRPERKSTIASPPTPQVKASDKRTSVLSSDRSSVAPVPPPRNSVRLSTPPPVSKRDEVLPPTPPPPPNFGAENKGKGASPPPPPPMPSNLNQGGIRGIAKNVAKGEDLMAKMAARVEETKEASGQVVKKDVSREYSEQELRERQDAVKKQAQHGGMGAVFAQIQQVREGQSPLKKAKVESGLDNSINNMIDEMLKHAKADNLQAGLNAAMFQRRQAISVTMTEAELNKTKLMLALMQTDPDKLQKLTDDLRNKLAKEDRPGRKQVLDDIVKICKEAQDLVNNKGNLIEKLNDYADRWTETDENGDYAIKDHNFTHLSDEFDKVVQARKLSHKDVEEAHEKLDERKKDMSPRLD